jgi:predicted nuclease of restriction endonuclease-like RecB superfamily
MAKTTKKTETKKVEPKVETPKAKIETPKFEPKSEPKVQKAEVKEEVEITHKGQAATIPDGKGGWVQKYVS